MSKFIEKLYYSNIDMQEASNAFTPKAKHKFRELIEREENIKKLLPDEVKNCLLNMPMFIVIMCI
ncbi:MAG: hypothetical protein IJB74_10080 [Clostridia bacterium]|nr:hypothetical protein [Clostridia bacterium]